MRTDLQLADLLRSPGAHHPDPARPPLFFTSPRLDQLLRELARLTDSSKLIPLLKAPTGAGKSTLAYQFLHRAPAQWLLCRIDANPMMHPDQLVALLSHTFGIREEADQATEQLLDRLFELRRQGYLPVVLIDDAELLPPSAFVTLLRLHEQHRDGVLALRILFFAGNDIDGLLKSPSIAAMNLQVLKPIGSVTLDRLETERYIRHFLAASGHPSQVALPAAQVERIYRESEGLPGRIEERVLALLGEGELRLPAGPLLTWRRLLIGSGAFAVAFLVGWGAVEYFDGGAPDQPEPPSLAATPASEVGPVIPETVAPSPGPEIAADDGGVQRPVPPPAPVVGDPIVAAVSVEIEGVAVAPPPEGQIEGGGAVLPEIASVAPAVVDELPSPIEEPPEAPVAEEVASVEVAAEVPEVEATNPPPPPLPTEAPSPPAAMPEKVPEPAPPIDRSPPKPPEPPPEVEVAPRKPAVAAASPARVPAPAKGIQQEEWLLAQDPAQYTIQLVAVSREDGARSFFERHRMGGVRAYFMTRRRGKVWFSVLQGVYADRAQAKAAVAGLPSELRDQGVWVRSFASVQAEIRELRR